MRIACLQFAPQVGDVNNNLNRADAVLNKANPGELDLLVLPELAFSGYNFKSLREITPFLEFTGSGITSLWARTIALKYDCPVAVGYPEKVDVSPKWPTGPEYYNSVHVVNSDGETVANYRKTHLYVTDETWALEGDDGFYAGDLPRLGNTAIGICMDLNPYRFEAPWDDFEFGHHILEVAANLVIVSMAWLAGEDGRSFSRMPQEPDMDTLMYWVKRLEPLVRAEKEEEVIIVFCNRTGSEGDAIYAGTSAVLGIKSGEVRVYGILGRGDKELLVVDTDRAPIGNLVYRPEVGVARVETYTDDAKTPTEYRHSAGSNLSPRNVEAPAARGAAEAEREDAQGKMPPAVTRLNLFRPGATFGTDPNVDSTGIPTPSAPSPVPAGLRPKLVIPKSAPSSQVSTPYPLSAQVQSARIPVYQDLATPISPLVDATPVPPSQLFWMPDASMLRSPPPPSVPSYGSHKALSPEDSTPFPVGSPVGTRRGAAAQQIFFGDAPTPRPEGPSQPQARPSRQRTPAQVSTVPVVIAQAEILTPPPDSAPLEPDRGRTMSPLKDMYGRERPPATQPRSSSRNESTDAHRSRSRMRTVERASSTADLAGTSKRLEALNRPSSSGGPKLPITNPEPERHPPRPPSTKSRNSSRNRSNELPSDVVEGVSGSIPPLPFRPSLWGQEIEGQRSASAAAQKSARMATPDSGPSSRGGTKQSHTRSNSAGGINGEGTSRRSSAAAFRDHGRGRQQTSWNVAEPLEPEQFYRSHTGTPVLDSTDSHGRPNGAIKAFDVARTNGSTSSPMLSLGRDKSARETGGDTFQDRKRPNPRKEQYATRISPERDFVSGLPNSPRPVTNGVTSPKMEPERKGTPKTDPQANMGLTSKLSSKAKATLEAITVKREPSKFVKVEPTTPKAMTLADIGITVVEKDPASS